MKNKLPVMMAGLAVLTLGSWGCATNKHVAQVIAPVQKQVDDVQKQGADNKQAIGDLDRQVSVADEKATDAGKRASEAAAAAAKANDAATQAGQRADGARTMAEETQASLRGVVDNLDNYRMVDEKKVYFQFAKSDLTKEEQATLDEMVGKLGKSANVVIEIEGYTDRVGTKNANLVLSEKRAGSVVRYLASHDIPLRRIHQLGLGDLQDEGKRANKEDRRVDIRVFARDSSTGKLQANQAPQAAQPNQ